MYTYLESLSCKRHLSFREIQKRATKLVKGYEKLPYEQILRPLGICTLICHHQRGDLMITTTLTLHSFLYHLMLPALEVTLRSYPRLNIHSDFFTQQVIGSWNRSPNEIVTANTITASKAQLDNYWLLKGPIYVVPALLK